MSRAAQRGVVWTTSGSSQPGRAPGQVPRKQSLQLLTRHCVEDTEEACLSASSLQVRAAGTLLSCLLHVLRAQRVKNGRGKFRCKNKNAFGCFWAPDPARKERVGLVVLVPRWGAACPRGPAAPSGAHRLQGRGDPGPEVFVSPSELESAQGSAPRQAQEMSS